MKTLKLYIKESLFDDEEDLISKNPYRFHPKNKKELLTEETLELLTTPSDLTEFKDAIMKAMTKGTKRNIESEDNGSKNEQTE